MPSPRQRLSPVVALFAACSLTGLPQLSQPDGEVIPIAIHTEMDSEARSIVSVTFEVSADAHYVAEYREAFSDEYCPEWVQLPGAPHNEGWVLDEAVGPLRLYRVLRIDAPASPVFAILQNDTGIDRRDGWTADAGIVGIAQRARGDERLLLRFSGTSGAETDITSAIGQDDRFFLSHEEVSVLAGGALEAGPQEVNIRLVDRAGQAIAAHALSFNYDDVPPRLDVRLADESAARAPFLHTPGPHGVTLEGTTEPSQIVELAPGGRRAVADAEGRFAIADVTAFRGDNLFTLSALDAACNESALTVNVPLGAPARQEALESMLEVFPDWIVTERGGTAEGRGSVFLEDFKPLLFSGDSTLVSLEMNFTVPAEASTLKVRFSELSQMEPSEGGIKDAVEVLLLDSEGRSLVYTIDPEKPQRDAFFNQTAMEPPRPAPGAEAGVESVSLNLTDLAPGTQSRLLLRLVSNDPATTTRVKILSIETTADAPALPSGIPLPGQNQQGRSPAIDVSTLIDVTPAIAVSYHQTTFHERSRSLFAEAAFSSRGQDAIRGPLIAVVEPLSQASVQVRGADGTMPNGAPYYDLTPLLADGSLSIGSDPLRQTLAFYNPQGVHFDYRLRFFAAPNSAPVFVKGPPTETLAGRAFTYVPEVVDPDGDPVMLSLLARPAGMTFDATTGTLRWNPLAEDLGQHTVLILADDSRGGTAQQAFNLRVRENAFANRPPAITSPPVVAAFVGAPYAYLPIAVDPDGDPVTLNILHGPTGLRLDASGELALWTPTPDQVGLHPVTLEVDDGRGGRGEQIFEIFVDQVQDNSPPAFVTTPPLTHTLPGESNPALGDLAPESLRLDLDPGETWTGNVALTLAEGSAMTGAADVVFLVDESGSMAGEHAWLSEMVPSLESALTARGIGPNRYFLGGYTLNTRLHNFGGELQLEVFGPDHQRFASETWESRQSSGGPAITFPRDGDYTLVFQPTPTTPTLDYDLGLQLSAAGTAPLSGFDIVHAGTLAGGAIFETTFSAPAGEVVVIDVQDTENFDRSIFDADGTEIANFFTGDSEPLSLPASSTYIVRVRNGSSGDRDYRFRVLRVTAPLPVDTLITGTLASGESDASGLASQVFSYDGTAGETLYIASNGAVNNGRFTLYGPDDEGLGHAFFNGEREYLLATTGQHTLIVAADDESAPVDFEILASPSTVNDETIALNTLVTGELTRPGEVNRYAFNGSRGQKIFFDGLASEHTGIDGALHSPSGLELFDDRRNISRDLTTDHGFFVLPEDGTYWVTVDAIGDSIGTYAFRLLDPDVHSTEITLSTDLAGTLSQPSGVDFFRFEATAGQRLFLDHLDSSGRINWSLLSPRNVRTFFNSLGMRDRELVLEESGTYYLQIIGSDDDVFPTFETRVNRAAAPTEVVSFNSPIEGTIAQAGDQPVFAFTASAGDRFVFDGQERASTAFFAPLYDPSNEELSNQNVSSDAAPRTLTQDGTYRYRLNVGDDTGAFAFQLLSPWNLTPGTPQSGPLSARESIAFRFDGLAGQTADFITSVSSGSGTWKLYGPFDESIRSTNRRNDFTEILPSDGEYILVIENSSASEDSSYDFEVTLTDPVATALGGFDTVQSGSLAAGATVDFVHSAPAGTLTYFDYLRDDESDFRVQLIAPDAELIFNDSLARDRGPLLLEQSGNYTLRFINESASETHAYAFRFLGPPAALPFDTPLSGNLEHAAMGYAAAWFQFSANAGEFLYVESITGDASSRWEVLTAAGNDLDGDGLNDSLFTVLPATQSYFLLFDGDAPAPVPYEFEARVTDLAFEALAFETVASGTLAPRVSKFYTLDLTAGDLVYFDGLSSSGSIRVSLRNPLDGARINALNPDADSAPVVARYDGDYILEVENRGDTTGDYSFRILDPGAAPALPFGVETTEALDPGTATRLYRLPVAAVQRFYLDPLGISGGGDYRIYEPDGDLRELTTSADRELNLTGPGEFYLAVRGGAAAPTSSTFTAYAPEDVVADASFDETLSGAITTPGERRVYRFVGQAGQRVRFNSIDPPGLVSLSASLIGRGGETLGELDFPSDDFGPVTLPDDATYHLVVDGNSAATRSYTSHLLELSEAPLFAAGDSVAGAFISEDAVLTLRVRATAGQTLKIGNNQLGGSATEVLAAFAELSTTAGGTENGYRALEAATSLPFRDGAAVNFILVTDEDCDCSAPVEELLPEMLAKLDAIGATLNVVVNAIIRDGDEAIAVGVDSDLITYLPDGAGGFVPSTPGTTKSGPAPAIASAAGTKDQYIDLAWATGGAAWDLNQLREGGLFAESFTAAFVEIKAEEIFAQLAALDLVAADATAPFTNLTGPLANVASGEEAVFEISLAGEDFGRSFDLLFVRPRSGNIVGSLPVIIHPEYLYAADALDADDDPLTYELGTAPLDAMVDPVTGLLAWSPLAPGAYPFSLTVSDGRGGRDQQDFIVQIDLGEANTAPEVLALPGTTATVGRAYRGFVEATDADGDPLSFFFDGAPEGMQIGRRSGLVEWTPLVTQLGEHPVSVRVIDRLGGQTTEIFTVTAVPDLGNARPVFTSAPVNTARPGETYRYEAIATDADGDVISYRLALAPDGMSVGTNSGVVLWTPTTGDSGVANVVLRADDGHGGVTLQAFAIDVAGANGAPVFLSSPPLFAGVGTIYRYDPVVQEPDGDALSFFLDVGPDGMTVDGSTGRLSWSPSGESLGDHPIVLEVRDDRGAMATQSYSLEVVDLLANDPPSITSRPRPVTALGVEWSYLVAATDPNDDPVTLSLETAPAGMTINAAGLMRWTPTPAQFGENAVTVRAEDPYGAFATQSFTVEVGSLETNSAPRITSRPPTVTVVGRDYAYDATALDDDGDPLVWSLETRPDGLSVDALRGTVRWRPVAAQTGAHPVTLVVTDALGVSATQEFTLTVNPVNTPPSIASIPVTRAAAGVNYFYAVEASDAEGDPLTFSLTTHPGGLVIDPTSGLIQWTPSLADVGLPPVTVQVADAFGGLASQSYTIEVLDVAPNDPPTIASAPTFAATAGDLYAYAVSANDPEDDPLTFSLPTAPAGMGIDGSGLLTWTPTVAQAGAHPVRVLVSDDRGNAAYQDFNVTVLLDNAAPTITSAPPGPATAGQPYVYDVLATDPDGDALAYSLPTAPTGMTIDGSGRLRWTPIVGDAGTATVVIRVEDPTGASSQQSFELPVFVDSEAPSVLISVDENPVLLGTVVTITVTAVDDIAVTALTATLDGVPLVLNGLGQATFTPDASGTYLIAATATDALGNEGSDSLSLIASESPDSSAPFVFIHTPEPSDSITTFTDVIATVTDADLAFYTLEVAPAEGGDFRELLRGTEAVEEATIGAFDPTLLENGPYRLRVVAEDLLGQRSIDEIRVDVAGSLKLGNYRITFNDLLIPLSGIPISVSRTYDTLRANRSGDLGYGWRLELFETRLRTTLSEVAEPGDEILPAFRFGTRVFVTLPDGRREGFTFNAELNNPFFPIFDPVFIPDVGVDSTLEVDTHDLRFNDATGEFESYLERFPYNPGAPAFGGVYRLTTKDGLTYRIDGISGDLIDLSDRNGNTLTFEEAGIFSSTGEQVDFERDAQGRITAVIDPLGQRIAYTYNATGDLTAVTDREGHTTTFHYRADPAHYLEEIHDPLGRMGERSEYDADGRLVRRINGTGGAIEFSYDPENSLHTTTDALGNTSTLEYDPSGNVISEIDPLGGIRRNAYDSNNRLLTTTNALGYTVSYAYDANGNITSRTDQNGATNYYTYNTFDLPLTETDPLGNVTTYTYDSAGNRTSITDPTGATSTFAYNSRGDLVSMTDPNGNVTTYTYNGRGHPIAMTDPRGVTTTMTNDANGNRLTESTLVTTPDGVVERTVTRTFDAEDQLSSETNAVGETTLFEYDALGRLNAMTDPNGNRTELAFDASGKLTAQSFADGATIAIAYDGKERRSARTDADGRVVEYGYDAADRLTAVLMPDDTPEDTTDNPRKVFEYDLAGRRTAMIDERGARTEYAYDARGRLMVERDALGGEWSWTYNVANRPLSQTDPLGRRTRFFYDAAGRRTRILHPDGFSEYTAYDARGRIIEEMNPLGEATRFEYNALDDLTAVIDPLGHRTEYAYDEWGNLVSQTDANGHVTKIEYDGAGRRTATERPLGQRTTAAYDGAGNLASVTNFDGTVVAFTYDEANRLATKDLPGADDVTYTYDPSGRRASVVDHRGTTVYDYDPRGHLQQRSEPDGQSISWEYDTAGKTTQRTTASGLVDYSYDALGRLATVTDPDDGVTTYTYDAAGNRLTTTLPNGVVETRTYDARDRVRSIEQAKEGTVLSAFDYTYDAAGRRTRVVEAHGRTVDYTYDPAGRLLGETITQPDSSVQRFDYTYDPVGNRLSKTDSTAGLTTYTYDDNDRLLAEIGPSESVLYAYDTNGRLERRDSTVSGLTTYSWDAEGRMTAAQTPTQTFTYGYNADGLRVSESADGVESRFLYGSGHWFLRLAETYAPDGTPVTNYTHGHGLIAQSGSGGTAYFGPDALGSVRTLTDAGGAITDTFTYDAYGRTLEHVGSTPTRYGFAGELHNASTGLSYLTARYLDPRVGRFTSPDPFEGSLRRPSSLHRYAYASADPVNIVDPTGRWDLVSVNMTTAIISDFQQAFGQAGTTALQTIRKRAAHLTMLGGNKRRVGLDMIAQGHDAGIPVFNRGEELLGLAMEQIREALSKIGKDTISNLNLLGKGLKRLVDRINHPVSSFIYDFAGEASALYEEIQGYGEVVGNLLFDFNKENLYQAFQAGARMTGRWVPPDPPFGLPWPSELEEFIP